MMKNLLLILFIFIFSSCSSLFNIRPKDSKPTIFTYYFIQTPQFSPCYYNKDGYSITPIDSSKIDLVRGYLIKNCKIYEDNCNVLFKETFNKKEANLFIGEHHFKSTSIGDASLYPFCYYFSHNYLHIKKNYPQFPSYYLDLTIFHELGHILGLRHSHNGNSIMYPLIYKSNVSLDHWDKYILIKHFGPPNINNKKGKY